MTSVIANKSENLDDMVDREKVRKHLILSFKHYKFYKFTI